MFNHVYVLFLWVLWIMASTANFQISGRYILYGGTYGWIWLRTVIYHQISCWLYIYNCGYVNVTYNLQPGSATTKDRISTSRNRQQHLCGAKLAKTEMLETTKERKLTRNSKISHGFSHIFPFFQRSTQNF